MTKTADSMRDLSLCTAWEERGSQNTGDLRGCLPWCTKGKSRWYLGCNACRSGVTVKGKMEQPLFWLSVTDLLASSRNHRVRQSHPTSSPPAFPVRSKGLATQPLHALQPSCTEMPPEQQSVTRNPAGFKALILPWTEMTLEH